MLKSQYQWASSFGSKVAATNVILVANALVWYASILVVLENNLGMVGAKSWLDQSSQVVVWSLHFALLIFSALVGAKIARRIDRMKFLTVWMALNVISSLTIFGLGYTNFIVTAALVSFYAVSFGLGMPICMSLFSDSIPVENRGRTSGIIMLISGIGILAFADAPLNFFDIGIALSIWRLCSLVIFLAVRPSLKVEPKKAPASFKNVLGQRSFIAYYIPWVLFSCVNFLVPLTPTQPTHATLLIQTIFLAIFSVVGGFLLDSVGRKRIAITGFIMLGLAAAANGFGQPTPLSIYFSSIFEGAAWGLLLVLFILTLWSDLSGYLPSEKYYAVGVAPFFASMLIGVTFGNWIILKLSNTPLFTFAAFFLFVAVLPLFYETENLPEVVIKGRDIKSYTEKAIKKAQEETRKGIAKSEIKKTNDNDEGKKDDEGDKYEEARKLAEKYY